MRNIFKITTLALLALLLAFCLAFVGCDVEKNFDDEFENVILNSTEKATRPIQTDSEQDTSDEQENIAPSQKDPICDLLGIPQFTNKPFAAVNSNKPTFTAEEITTKSYEFFSDLDSFGRCGYVMACIGKDLMPTEDRGEIGHIKPTGWVQGKYDTSLVSGGVLYNRCHLIGFQLTGENDNDKNLITGTRYMNWDGMVDFENMIADYVKETGNHVMYRVTPMFYENELVARGVHMEAYSVEDNGEGISFNVYAYNVQPGITIDYKTGKNWLSTEQVLPEEDENTENGEAENENGSPKYILNTNNKKVHIPTCSSANQMLEGNRQEYNGDLDELIAEGYTKCGICRAGT